MGLTEEEYRQCPAESYPYENEVKQRMLAAGAHHVLDNITELPLYIATLNKSLNQ